MHVSDEQFEAWIAEAMDSLPERFLAHVKNVAIVWDISPSPEQRQKLRMRSHDQLYGLYEGIPLINRGDNYNLVLPDKITIFKEPLVHLFDTESDIKAQIKHTLWHEIAHHYGLDHDRIHELEDN